MGIDLFSVALHEIGHVLGIGDAPSWIENIDQNAEGDNIFLGDEIFNVSGSTIKLDSEAGHFAEGTAGFGGGLFDEQGALMNPSIVSGERRLPTNIDFAAFKDIGWEPAPVPVPAAVWLFGTGLLGLLGFRKRCLV